MTYLCSGTNPVNAKVVTAMPALSETKKRRVKLVHCQRPMGPMWPRMASKSTFEKAIINITN